MAGDGHCAAAPSRGTVSGGEERQSLAVVSHQSEMHLFWGWSEDCWEGEWAENVAAFWCESGRLFRMLRFLEIALTVRFPRDKEFAARSIGTHGVIVVADAADRGTEVAAFGA